MFERRSVAMIVFAVSLVSSAAVAARPAVIELYTSQGCSSCPPAERLMEQLAGRTDVLPLAFHVDYWDSLGWRDRFSMQEATSRQQNTARFLGLDTVGTPQWVVDGRIAIWGASREALEHALRGPRSDLAVNIQRRGPEVVISSEAPVARDPYVVFVIGYLPRAETVISRGENAGRTLTEVNIVRYIRNIGTSNDSRLEWHLRLEDIPKEAERLAILLQQTATGAIIGARTLARDDLENIR